MKVLKEAGLHPDGLALVLAEAILGTTAVIVLHLELQGII
jgi:hypothetical protein